MTDRTATYRTGIRGFRAGDGRHVVEAWRRSAPADPITPDRFRSLVLLDANFDPEGLRVAVEGGRVVGAAYAVRRLTPVTGTDLEPGQGWIPFFFVDPAARGHGLGRRLLTDALDWLHGHGRTRVDFSSYTPNYILPGLDAGAYPEAAGLLESLGFRTLYEAAAMDRGLVGYRFPADVACRLDELRAQGHRFVTPSDDDLVELVALAGNHFNPDWARAIRECLAAGTPLDRIVVARNPSGRLVGWAMHGAYESVDERFGPFGVLEETRGTGLGKVLLHLVLERMRARGAHSAWFLWTGERSAAGHLYRKAGFTTTRVFRVMRREAAR
ncbi:GNAT superfamily N-acetyltransferase [Streptomyces griseochromogenes]|uniref:Acetyltransferase n=1 Tax=Streptomyces griseochromogenes TaxID=68214 RepID=A0A1B1AWW2_9ACTN|nr:GNAT family N-acetyltransferase [Streptomyces griseochromogenes]ANP51027.1 acetyltransferase [Streptomyces griseochromogenes]MBP2052041.1 GNAT superfamily N-acetyltransferase [Streptomyces griseochromogenes]